MKIAIVILNWNGKALLQKFLPNIIEHSDAKLATIYVADNASTDDSIAFVKQNFPKVKIIENVKNYGFAKGYNVALRDLDEDIFALVNSDIEVTKGWLDPIVKMFRDERETAVIQPKILDYKDRSKFEYAGAAGGFIDKYGYPFCRGRIFHFLEKDTGQYNDQKTIFWASGACFFIRKEVFNKANGFDADYFAHQEEIDLCWRIKNSGYEVKYNGLSVVYHIGGATLDNANPKKTYLNFRNSLFNLVKNAPGKSLFSTVLVRLVLDGIAGVKFFFEGKPLHTWAIIRSHFSFYGKLNKMFKKRKQIKTKVDRYYHVKSVVKAHYIHKKKLFHEL